jgi:hypothetical protein
MFALIVGAVNHHSGNGQTAASIMSLTVMSARENTSAKIGQKSNSFNIFLRDSYALGLNTYPKLFKLR